jgi:hypothetical protein
LLLQHLENCEQVSCDHCIAPIPVEFGNKFTLPTNVALAMATSPSASARRSFSVVGFITFYLLFNARRASAHSQASVIN